MYDAQVGRVGIKFKQEDMDFNSVTPWLYSYNSPGLDSSKTYQGHIMGYNRVQIATFQTIIAHAPQLLDTLIYQTNF